jgi:MoxR-like ATPase
MLEMPGSPQRPSNGWTRREILRISGLSLLGLNLLDTCRGDTPHTIMSEKLDADLMAMLDKYRNLHSRIHAEMAKVVVGQTQLVDEVLMALFCNAHVLLTGAPGVAKNLTLYSLARVLGLSWMRIQHTDDLLPEDITGSEVLCLDEGGGRCFKTCLGPIFANMVLADCFDCAPPMTQAVLFETMQARQVQVGQQMLPLERPFLVMVMENPREGQYPLDESHRTRFMFNACFAIPSEADDLANCKLYGNGAHVFSVPIETVLSKADIEQIQILVRRMPVLQPVVDYALQLVRLTRPGQQYTPAFVQDSINWGIGPRGAQFLIRGAKAHAVLHGQPHASIEGVRAVAPGVLRHRIELKASAKAQGLDGEQIVARLLKFFPSLPGSAW